MQLPVIKYLFASETMHALFYTLVHSLWQGLLLALMAGIILMFTKRSVPVLRYKLFCGLLMVFVACNLLTFYYELNLADKINTAIVSNIIASIANNDPDGLNNSGRPITIIEETVQFVKSYEAVLVFTWFLVIAFKCIYVLTGLKQIYLLKHREVFYAGEFWNSRLQEFAARIGVNKPVEIMKSSIAKIPMVIGHFKPVILFPASLLIALPQEETEAILLHELAHIRRKDYLVNMLQNFIGIIFFFNPALLWISSLIKTERENCCDDIAVSEIKNKNQLIHALVSFQEYNINTSKYAASFPGNKNHLLNRVRRIITNNNKTLNNMEKIFLTSGLIITGFLMASFSYNKQFHFTQKETVTLPANNNTPVKQTDTVQPGYNNKSKNTITTSFEGKEYKIVEINGKITELYIDNERIPNDKIPQYESAIAKIRQQAEEQMNIQAAQKALMEKQVELMKQKELLMKEQEGKQNDQLELLQKKLIAEAEMMEQKEFLAKEQMEKQPEIMKHKELLMKEELSRQDEQKNLLQKELMLNDKIIKQNELLKLKQMIKQSEQIELQQKVLIEKQTELIKQKELLMKEQSGKDNGQMELLKESIEKQSEQMKLKNNELIDQMQQLKKQQLQKEKIRDSINQLKPVTPKGLIKPVHPDLITTDVATNL